MRGDSSFFQNMDLSNFVAPVNPDNLFFLWVTLLAIGVLTMMLFFLYELSVPAKERKLLIELSIGGISSICTDLVYYLYYYGLVYGYNWLFKNLKKINKYYFIYILSLFLTIVLTLKDYQKYYLMILVLLCDFIIYSSSLKIIFVLYTLFLLHLLCL